MRSRAADTIHWIWPDANDPESAEKAANVGVVACFIVAGLCWMTVLNSILQPIQGVEYDPWAAVDAILFTTAGWRVSKLSRLWSLLALILFVGEVWSLVVDGRWPLAFGSLLFLNGMISGVRGTFASHHLRQRIPANERSNDCPSGPGV
jgi:hypothetical protein